MRSKDRQARLLSGLRFAIVPLVLTLLAPLATTLALAHGGGGPTPDGRIKGLGDFKRVGKTTYRYLPARGEYEVRAPGQPTSYLHGDPASIAEEEVVASEEEEAEDPILEEEGLAPYELNPICRTSGHRVVAVYTHRPTDKAPVPIEELRDRVRWATWKLAYYSALSSDESRIAKLAADCDAEGNISVYDIATEENYPAAIRPVISKQLFGFPTGSNAVRYLVFDAEKYPGGGYSGLAQILNDATKGPSNKLATTTLQATVYGWHTKNNTHIHELLHTLGATQGNATPLAPYSTPGHHCIDGFDVMCYDDGGAYEGKSYSTTRCPSSKGYESVLGKPIDCGEDTYFDAAPEPGSWLDKYWNVAGPEDPFLVALPKASTSPASPVASSGATLNGALNPEGYDVSYHFEYGPTGEYGLDTATKEVSFGAEDIEVSQAIEGLAPGTTYHYRLVAESDAGTVYGADESFKTPGPIWAASYGSKGSGGGAFEGLQFEHPYGVAADNEGNVWVADSLNHRAEKVSPSGQFILMVGEEVNKTKVEEEAGEEEENLCTAASGDTCGPGTGSQAVAVAIDPKGDVWVSDSDDSEIAHYTTDGEYLGATGTYGKGEGQLNHPDGIAFDEEGNLLVADQGNSRVVKYGPEGEFLDEFGSKGEGDGQLTYAKGLTVDPAGNIWVADTQNSRIQKFDGEGKFIAKYGSYGTGKGQFRYPYGIAADANGVVWVADSGNDRVQALSKAGEYLTQFGKYGTGNGQFNGPKALALGAKGDIWVADTSNHRIQRWIFPGKPEGKTENALDVKSTSAMLRGTLNPNGIAKYRFEYGTTTSYGSSVPVSGAEEGPRNSAAIVNNTAKGLTPVTTYHFRLVAESEFGTVYGEDKTFTTTADDRFDFSFGTAGTGNGQLKGPVGTVTDSKGNVWVADTENNRIEKFGPYGEYLSQFGSLGTGNGQLKGPKGVAIDSSGNLWVTDTGNDRVQKFDSSGKYLSQFGSTGTGNGQFKSPTGIAIDSKGRIYVVDTGNNRVQKFDSSGKYLEQGGSEGTGNGQFKSPSGIAVDSQNRVWVVDTGNNRVQRLSNTLVYQAQFGAQGTGNGQLESPSSILIDYGEKLWVTDTGNDRVQRFNEAGEYLEKFGQHGSGPGQIDDPLGIASPSAWKLVFVDAANSRVQQWSMSPDAPVASTEAATELKETTATLNASINPNGLYTEYRFEYGKTTSYGTSVPVPDAYAGNGLGLVKVAKAISGLASKTKYNFRVVAISSSGTTYGVNKSFTTP